MQAFDAFAKAFGQMIGITGRDRQNRPILAGVLTPENLIDMFSDEVEAITCKYISTFAAIFSNWIRWIS